MRHEHVHDSCVEAQKAKNTHGTLLWTPRRTLMPMIPHMKWAPKKSLKTMVFEQKVLTKA